MTDNLSIFVNNVSRHVDGVGGEDDQVLFPSYPRSHPSSMRTSVEVLVILA